jgi:activin receptor type-2B
MNQKVTPKQYWLVVEYHQYGSLYDYLKINTVSWQQICNFSLSILNGLAYLHSEIVKSSSFTKPTIAHRDLKSKNILVKTNGTCCIADFGLALALRSGKLNSSDIKSQVGTRRYMSPELLEGAITFTKDTLLRIDVYACALVLWELISRGNFYGEFFFLINLSKLTNKK